MPLLEQLDLLRCGIKADGIHRKVYLGCALSRGGAPFGVEHLPYSCPEGDPTDGDDGREQRDTRVRLERPGGTWRGHGQWYARSEKCRGHLGPPRHQFQTVRA